MSEKVTAADFGLTDNEAPSLPPIDERYSPIIRYSASRNYERIYSMDYSMASPYYIPLSTEYNIEYYCAHCGAVYTFKGELHSLDSFNNPIKSRSTTCLSCGNIIYIGI